MDGRLDGQTYGQMDRKILPLCFTGLCSPWGRRPKTWLYFFKGLALDSKGLTNASQGLAQAFQSLVQAS